MSPTNVDFETVVLHDLETMSEADRDALPFGVVGFAADTIVQVYNATDPAQLSARIEQVMVARLADHKRPKNFRFGSALPRNAMGKLEDWT